MKKCDASEEKIASIVSKMQETELSWIPEDTVLDEECPVSEEFEQRMEHFVTGVSGKRRKRRVMKTLATVVSVAIVLLVAVNYPCVVRAKQFVVRWIEQKRPENSMVEAVDTETETVTENETETTSSYPMRGSTEEHNVYRVEQGADGKIYVYKSKRGKEIPCCEEFIHGLNPETGACDMQGYTYYVGAEGYLYQNGWFLTKYGQEYQWRYFDEDGALARKWRQIDGEWYYFDYSGIPVRDKTLEIDGESYYFDVDGKWIPQEETPVVEVPSTSEVTPDATPDSQDVQVNGNLGEDPTVVENGVIQ